MHGHRAHWTAGTSLCLLSSFLPSLLLAHLPGYIYMDLIKRQEIDFFFFFWSDAHAHPPYPVYIVLLSTVLNCTYRC